MTTIKIPAPKEIYAKGAGGLFPTPFVSLLLHYLPAFIFIIMLTTEELRFLYLI